MVIICIEIGNRKFDDKTDVAGVRESGWGGEVFDFDNDGDLTF